MMIYNNISQWRDKEDISRRSTITLVNEEVKNIFYDDLQ